MMILTRLGRKILQTAFFKGDDMHAFNEYLIENFGRPLNQLSDTGFGNVLMDSNAVMISLDEMAESLPNIKQEFKQHFASVDALLITENGGEFELYFIEFKNMNFNRNSDRLMSKNLLNQCIFEIDKCEYGCEVLNDLRKCSKYLVDRHNVSMRSKPFDSLSVMYFFMKDYFEFESEQDCMKRLFELKKYFILVSRTESEFFPSKNRNNRKNSIINPLKFLNRLKPYHYDEISILSYEGFFKFMEMINS